MWRSLFREWAKSGFGDHILILDRAASAPHVPGLRYRQVSPYAYTQTAADTKMLQHICDEERADLFVSTYYTTPITTPSAFLAYDMIPEILGGPISDQVWREKHFSILHASIHMAISKSTAGDLAKTFPSIDLNSITVAYCGVDPVFAPAKHEAIKAFRDAHHINKPYFLLVGDRSGYAGYKNCQLFFQSFAALSNKSSLAIVCVGGNATLEEEFQKLVCNESVFHLNLNDPDLSTAYSGAIALVFPSKYEGFGMPVVEALACQCPVITCNNSSIAEIAGDAPFYVDENDVSGLTNALLLIQDEALRTALSSRAPSICAQFSWSNMADKMAKAISEGVRDLKQDKLCRPIPLWTALRTNQEELQGHIARLKKELEEEKARLTNAHGLLAGMQNSPFWKLRKWTLRALRPVGIRRSI